MRLSIERMRTLVLAAGVLLVVALAAFLAIGKWRNPFNRRDMPRRLGINIQEEANGFTYTQSHGGHTLFKIHASKVIQLKKGNALLHDVRIELYGPDGKSVDRIEGSEFEYDQQAGLAKAAGAVEITIMRPGVAPAIASRDNAEKAESKESANRSLMTAQEIARGEIHVETSGLVFDQNSGVASTNERVEFALTQGKGSATGALYDSQQGRLVLDRDVELNVRRGPDPVNLEAQHAEFERGDQICALHVATVIYRGGQAKAEDAMIHFRNDGSAAQLDAANGFLLTSAMGGKLAAPTGSLEFDEHNQPQHGELQGGVIIDQVRDGRTVHGTAPTMKLLFTAAGQLSRAHLETGVQISSQEQNQSSDGVVMTSRRWASPVADLEFRNAGHGQVELASIHGTGGVLVTARNQRGRGALSSSRMTADEITANFGANSSLSAMNGTGHATMEQTTPSGARQTISGDKLEARFDASLPAGSVGTGKSTATNSARIQSAIVDGHVVLMDYPANQSGAATQAPLRATAGHAIYQNEGQWLHLLQNPRVENGELQLAADRIDVSQTSGDAFAHGNVKATWLGNQPDASLGQKIAGSNAPSISLGSQGPVHAIAERADVHQSTGDVVFHGQVRLWQQGDSIAAPEISLNRTRQTLVAHSMNPAEPVRVVMVSTTESASANKKNKVKSATPSVIRMRGSDLKYSEAERKAWMRSGAAGNVLAQTEVATTSSDEVELTLLPPDNRGGDGAAGQIESMAASGHVVITSQGRRGTGQKLTYTSDNGNYVLTGTAAIPPRLTDPVRGTVTGQALIFNTRDDSVSIEGDGGKTTTKTTAPR